VTDQPNVAFAGTLVTGGRRSEFGRVCSELQGVESPRSPLQIKIDELGTRLAALSVAAIAIIGIAGWYVGRPALETATVAVSLAVAAIPEGLPICVTVTLALGVLRMAKKRAIVKRLPAVEALGCASVVCSDKTGTLTQNEMTVRRMFVLAFPQNAFLLSGVGYDACEGAGVKAESLVGRPGPTIGRDGLEYPVLAALLGVGCLCNNASLGGAAGTPGQPTPASPSSSPARPVGQPTEIALLVASAKAGAGDARGLYVRTGEVPFSSDRKRMEVTARPAAGVHAVAAYAAAAPADGSGELRFLKGMPEAVLDECTNFTGPGGGGVALTDAGRRRVRTQARRMATGGMRVLAMAYGREGTMTFAGIVGMEDPPRDGVPEAVAELRRSGVRVVMITGDAGETAVAIARRVGILDGSGRTSPPVDEDVEDSCDEEPGVVLSGDDLESMGPEDLSRAVAAAHVFYRVAPRHKLMIVKALQSRGEVVAMTGDGVNDATALKAADIGVSMGRGGTDVAREASDMVLVDDDFSTICVAVKEGKGIFANIRSFLTFQLSTSLAALAMESVATLLGLPSPLNAMQILWINIIMDGPPAQSLGVEPVDGRVFAAKPRRASDPIVTRALMMRVVSSAALIVFGTLRVYFHELEDGVVTRRDTTMTFMTFVNFDLFHAYACRSSQLRSDELRPFDNMPFVWAVGFSFLGQLAVVYFPPLQQVFQTEALSLLDMAYIMMLASSILWLDTLRKRFFRGTFDDAVSPSSALYSGRGGAGRDDPRVTEKNMRRSLQIEEGGGPDVGADVWRGTTSRKGNATITMRSRNTIAV